MLSKNGIKIVKEILSKGVKKGYEEIKEGYVGVSVRSIENLDYVGYIKMTRYTMTKDLQMLEKEGNGADVPNELMNMYKFKDENKGEKSGLKSKEINGYNVYYEIYSNTFEVLSIHVPKEAINDENFWVSKELEDMSEDIYNNVLGGYLKWELEQLRENGVLAVEGVEIDYNGQKTSEKVIKTHERMYIKKMMVSSLSEDAKDCLVCGYNSTKILTGKPGLCIVIPSNKGLSYADNHIVKTGSLSCATCGCNTKYLDEKNIGKYTQENVLEQALKLTVLKGIYEEKVRQGLGVEYYYGGELESEGGVIKYNGVKYKEVQEEALKAYHPNLIEYSAKVYHKETVKDGYIK